MSKIGERVKCDNCGNEWTQDSPPSKEEYNAAHVHIIDMTVLVPDHVVALYHKEGVSDSHAIMLDNMDFCDIKCLAIYVQRYMSGRKP
jgi:hypothetical protein